MAQIDQHNTEGTLPAAPIDAASDPSPAAYRWIAKLPPDVRPFNLLRRFPHFVNALATRWPSKQACRTVLYEVIPAHLAHFNPDSTIEIRLELEKLSSYLEKLETSPPPGCPSDGE